MAAGQSGRERRRKGWINRGRRAAYGVLLWLSGMAPNAALAESAPVSGGEALLLIESFPLGATGYLSRYRVSFSPPDLRITQPLRKAAGLLRTRSWQFNDTLLTLRGGLGLDVPLADAGNLHLSLFPDDEEPERGKRWRLSTAPDARRNRLWSLGGSVDLVDVEPRHRWPSERDHALHLSPQLILDMDRLAGMPGHAQLLLQRAHWQNGLRDGQDERIWQLQVRWRF